MRNYTSKAQKVELYSKKYGLSREEVKRILSEHEVNLTFDELKIKYDNPDLGKLPDWIDPDKSYETIQRCIEIGVNSKYTHHWKGVADLEDLYGYMWEFILKRIHLMDSEAYIITSVKNRMTWLGGIVNARRSNFPINLEDNYGRSDDSNSCTYADILPAPDDCKLQDLIDLIESVNDEATRGLMYIVGYLNGIEELEPQFKKVLIKKDKKVRAKLKEYIAKSDARLNSNLSEDEKEQNSAIEFIETLGNQEEYIKELLPELDDIMSLAISSEETIKERLIDKDCLRTLTEKIEKIDNLQRKLNNEPTRQELLDEIKELKLLVPKVEKVVEDVQLEKVQEVTEKPKKARKVSLRDVITATAYNRDLIADRLTPIATAVQEVEDYLKFAEIKPNTTFKKGKTLSVVEMRNSMMGDNLNETHPVSECVTIDILQDEELCKKYNINKEKVLSNRLKNNKVMA